MTTAIEWPTVQRWLDANPTKGLRLPLYQYAETVTLDKDIVDADGWKSVLVSPTTPLSAILMAQDQLYASSSVGARHSLLRDETTDLQEKAVLHLKGAGWPMRKTAEGISGCGLEEERRSMWTEHGWRAICELRECQLVLFDETNKEVLFYPEDVRGWSSERETLFLDVGARSLYTPPAGQTLSKIICLKEADSWAIHWPLLDKNLKVDELKKEADKAGVASDKVTKDILRRKVGRAQTLSILSSWPPF